jgi:hypothetical protein
VVQGERGYLQGKVVGYLQGMMPLFFICHVGKVCGSMSCVSFMQVGGERERGRIAGKEDLKKQLLFSLLHVQRKKNNVVSKRHRCMILFVFFFEKKNKFGSNPKIS